MGRVGEGGSHAYCLVNKLTCSSPFCSVIDHEFGHGIVKVVCGSTRLKVAVDSRGDSQGDPQTTLTMLLRH